MEWFIAGTQPLEVDTDHFRVAVDARSGGPAGPDTPPDALRYEIIWKLPADLQDWARVNHVPQLAQFDTALATGDGAADLPLAGRAEAQLSLISPDPDATFHLDPVLPGSVQQLPVTGGPVPRWRRRPCPSRFLSMASAWPPLRRQNTQLGGRWRRDATRCRQPPANGMARGFLASRSRYR